MPYTPTTWVNNTPPPLSATNLNKLTNELKSQAALLQIAHDLPTWVNGANPSLSNKIVLNEMERVLYEVAVAQGLSYTKTVWDDGWTPPRNATNLNKMENQAQANRADLDANPPAPPPGPVGVPSIPTGLTATPGNGKVTLTWQANPTAEQVDRYQVYMNGAEVSLNVTGLNYIVTGLTNGTSYSFTISAHNVNGYGSQTATAVQSTPTAGTAPSGYYYFIDFEGASFPPANWSLENRGDLWGTTGTAGTITRVTDPLGIEGQVCSCRINYAPNRDFSYNAPVWLNAMYTGASTAYSGYNAVAQETWYRVKWMVPAGQNVFANGETNFMIEWHTDNNTQALGGNSSATLAYGGFPLTSGGTTSPTRIFRMATGTPSSPSYTCFPGPNVSSGYNSGNHGADLEAAKAAMGQTVQANRWYEEVFHFVWSKNAGTGKFQWWIDGVLKADMTMATLYANPSLPNGQAYNTFGVYNYKYNVNGTSTINYGLVALGPTAASVGFTP